MALFLFVLILLIFGVFFVFLRKLLSIHDLDTMRRIFSAILLRRQKFLSSLFQVLFIFLN